MDNLTAVATDYGLSILKSELKAQANTYQLIGASTHNATSTHVFFESDIESSYFDDNGVLTFVVNLPKDRDFNKYLYAVAIVDHTGQIIIKTDTPKIALARGIGGMLTIKAAVTGEPGQMVFKATDYITEPELIDLWMNPIYANTAMLIDLNTQSLRTHKQRIADQDSFNAFKQQTQRQFLALQASLNNTQNEAMQLIINNTASLIALVKQDLHQHNEILKIKGVSI